MNTGDKGKTTAGDELAGTPITELSAEEALELQRVFVRMPYGGGIGLRDVKRVDDVLHNLDVLEQTLEHVAGEAEAMRSELALWKIRKQVVRDLVGELVGVSTKAGAPE